MRVLAPAESVNSSRANREPTLAVTLPAKHASEMSHPIRGISKTALWQAWKAIRSDLKHSSIRDVVDFVDYDLNPHVWITKTLRDLAADLYQPRPPFRFTLAKSNGFSRRMTIPAIPDLVLYRTIVDYLYNRLRVRQHTHVYFEQKQRQKIETAALEDAQKVMASADAVYTTGRPNRYLAWLRYHQYRKYLIFRRVHSYIVTTDITNYFDTIHYDFVKEALTQTTIPPRMLGLLFLLLERLSLRGSMGESPRVGLPVDQFDCSRKLAHMVLFPHDDRMVAVVGEKAYVRWMDDQDFGVNSRAEGLRLLSAVGESLAKLHLTPNASKSRIMTTAEARRHFHFDLNARLDKLEKLPLATDKQRKVVRASLRELSKGAAHREGDGVWEKVRKRMYLVSGRAKTKAMRKIRKEIFCGCQTSLSARRATCVPLRPLLNTLSSSKA